MRVRDVAEARRRRATGRRTRGRSVERRGLRGLGCGSGDGPEDRKSPRVLLGRARSRRGSGLELGEQVLAGLSIKGERRRQSLVRRKTERERWKTKKKNRKRLEISITHQQRAADGGQLPPRGVGLGVPSRCRGGDGGGLDHRGPGRLYRGLGSGKERLLGGGEEEAKEKVR